MMGNIYNFSKQVLIVFLITMFFQSKTQAQNAIYLTGGPNFTKFGGVKKIPDEGIRGAAGLGFLKKSNEHVGISSELLYSAKGGRIRSESDFRGTYEQWDETFILHYIELQVLGNLFLCSDSSRIRPKFFAGPSVSYLFDADDYIDYMFVDESTVLESNGVSDVNQEFNSIDYGLVTGTGVNILFGKRMFASVDLRYTWGFRDISIFFPELKNRNLSGMVGFGFFLNR